MSAKKHDIGHRGPNLLAGKSVEASKKLESNKRKKQRKENVDIDISPEILHDPITDMAKKPKKLKTEPQVLSSDRTDIVFINTDAERSTKKNRPESSENLQPSKKHQPNDLSSKSVKKSKKSKKEMEEEISPNRKKHDSHSDGSRKFKKSKTEKEKPSLDLPDAIVENTAAERNFKKKETENAKEEKLGKKHKSKKHQPDELDFKPIKNSENDTKTATDRTNTDVSGNWNTWETVEFNGDSERRMKFLKLMGSKPKDAGTGVGNHSKGGDVINDARSKKLNDSLANQFEAARERQNSSKGNGFGNGFKSKSGLGFC